MSGTRDLAVPRQAAGAAKVAAFAIVAAASVIRQRATSYLL